MYEFGSYKDFCTSIPVTVVQGGIKESFLARNLDYGYQSYLAQNSIKLQYFRNSIIFVKLDKLLAETIGHAGLIGTHTGLKFSSNKYSITLNERTQGGLHLTLL
jgi:hypothetical protein